MKGNKLCGFLRAWVGKCKTPVTHPDGRCSEHTGLICSSCGAPATHDCDETMGAFICGALLCDECEHTLYSNGCNSGGALPEGLGSHCKKTEQVYQSWWKLKE